MKKLDPGTFYTITSFDDFSEIIKLSDTDDYYSIILFTDSDRPSLLYTKIFCSSSDKAFGLLNFNTFNFFTFNGFIIKATIAGFYIGHNDKEKLTEFYHLLLNFKSDDSAITDRFIRDILIIYHSL